MLKIKKDDEVVVIAGRDRGKRGEVLKVLDGGRLLVSGVNLVKKHQRPNPNIGQRGGIVEQEAPIDVSNVAIWNDETGKADRVAIRVDGDKKVRVFKSNDKAID
jgi:large subunit ribosomal protein L24